MCLPCREAAEAHAARLAADLKRTRTELSAAQQKGAEAALAARAALDAVAVAEGGLTILNHLVGFQLQHACTASQVIVYAHVELRELTPWDISLPPHSAFSCDRTLLRGTAGR